MNRIQTREIRLFVSSTFDDMSNERDFLLRNIFPVFREDCLRRHVIFTEIDLRWGVTETESKNGATVQRCLAEIDRCRDHPPFCLGLIGERYGWVPTFAELSQYWHINPDAPYRALIENALRAGSSLTELEMRFALSGNIHDGVFYLRNERLSRELFKKTGAEAKSYFDPRDGRLDALKRMVRDSGRVIIDGYDTIQEFGDSVLVQLRSALDIRYPVHESSSNSGGNESAQAVYAESRLRHFAVIAERNTALQTAVVLQIGTSSPPTLLVGPSGSGKSALLAYADRRQAPIAGAFIFAWYVGAENDSLTAWREALYSTLEQFAPQSEPSRAERSRWDSFEQRLVEAQIALAQPIVLLLDGLDQFSDVSEVIDALNHLRLPVNVAMIATTTKRPEFACDQWGVVDLAGLSASQKLEVIDVFARDNGKSFEASLLEMIVAASATDNLLYLKMVLEELRVHADFRNLSTRLSTLLKATDPAGLFSTLVQSWDTDYSDNVHHAPVCRFISLIAVSHRGLTEIELRDLCSAEVDPIDPGSGSARLPAVLFSPQLSALSPYLLNLDGRMTLMHRAIARGAVTSNSEAKLRFDLLAYFSARAAIPERVFQRIQLIRLSPGDDQVRSALKQELSHIASVIDLIVYERFDSTLLRSALIELDAQSAELNSLAVRLGEAWAAQLESFVTTNKGRFELVITIGNSLSEWSFYGASVPLLEAIVRLADSRFASAPDSIAGSLGNLGIAYEQQGRLDEAHVVYSLALDKWREVAAAGDLRLAIPLSNLGLLLILEDRFTEAGSLLAEALRIRRLQLPANHPMVSISLENLAVLRMHQMRMSEARALLRESATIRRAAIPQDDNNLSHILRTSASMNISDGNFVEAETELNEAFVRALRVKSTRHPDIGTSQVLLSQIRQHQGRLADAQVAIEDALSIFRTGLGKEHRRVAEALIQQGSILLSARRFEEADKAFGEAVDIGRLTFAPASRTLLSMMVSYLNNYERAHAKTAPIPLIEEYAKHRNVADLLNSTSPNELEAAQGLDTLAAMYLRQGRADVAIRVFKVGLRIRERLLGADNPLVAQTQAGIGCAMAALGKTKEGEGLAQQAINVLSGQKQIDFSALGAALQHLGALQHYAGRIPESEIAFTQALEALRRTSSTLTLSLASACANVSRILQNSDPTEAESLARESERIQQFYNDSERCPETAARAVGDLAQLHAAHGRTIEAEALYRKSIGLKRSLKGSRPLSLAITLDNYQVFLRKQGRIAEALTLASEALGLARSMAKVEHSFLASVLNNFAALQIERKEFADARMLLNEALLIRRAETPRDSRRLAILLSSIAALNVAEEDLPEAKAFFEEAISVLEKSGLPAHEMLMQLRQNVEEIRKEQVNHLI